MADQFLARHEHPPFPAAPAPVIASSRITGFAQMDAKTRVQTLMAKGILTPKEAQLLLQSGALPLEQGEHFIENCVGGFTLPLGIATNFLIDQEEVFVPMAVEESSVVAAASHGAKLARAGGGFVSTPTQTIATCQIQIFPAEGVDLLGLFVNGLKEQMVSWAQSTHPRLLARGGGVQSIELRALTKPGMYVAHINVDTKEAMGANIVNTMAEEVGRRLPEVVPCRIGCRILTNLTTHRLTKVSCEVPFEALARPGYTGEEAAERICQVWEFADVDPFRAATHNKGVMNGIDPVVIATGNDWRAVEAGCHAYAALSGTYKPLTTWSLTAHKTLRGEICVPIAVGTVGGVTRLHPAVSTCLKLMGSPSSAKLSAIIASVGLAQNLSALRALGCEGIQKGHMALHEKNLDMLRQYDHLPSISVVGHGTQSE